MEVSHKHKMMQQPEWEDGEEEKKKMKKTKTKNSRMWEDLDKDVLLNIYKKLENLKDLITGAPLCCSSWYMISKDSSLWQHVNLSDYKSSSGKTVPARKLLEFVMSRSQGLLSSITFPSNSSIDDLLLVAQRCPKLKNFDLRIYIGNVLFKKQTIAMSIGKLKELEGMEVNGDFISDEATLKQISESCPNFTKLKVHDSLSKDTASLITKYLPNLKIFDHPPFDDDDNSDDGSHEYHDQWDSYCDCGLTSDSDEFDANAFIDFYSL